MRRALSLAIALSACKLGLPPPMEPYVLHRATVARALDPEAVAVYAGLPREPYDVVALVAASSDFGEPLSELRAQAASLGCDAIVDFDAEGNHASGVAVRMRR